MAYELVRFDLDLATRVFDLFFAFEEEEDVTWVAMDHEDGADASFDVVWLGRFGVEDLDGVRAAGAFEERSDVSPASGADTVAALRPKYFWNLSASRGVLMMMSLRVPDEADDSEEECDDDCDVEQEDEEAEAMMAMKMTTRTEGGR